MFSSSLRQRIKGSASCPRVVSSHLCIVVPLFWPSNSDQVEVVCLACAVFPAAAHRANTLWAFRAHTVGGMNLPGCFCSCMQLHEVSVSGPRTAPRPEFHSCEFCYLYVPYVGCFVIIPNTFIWYFDHVKKLNWNIWIYSWQREYIKTQNNYQQVNNRLMRIAQGWKSRRLRFVCLFVCNLSISPNFSQVAS